MSKPLAFGLSLSKKPTSTSAKPGLGKTKAMFGGDDSDSDDQNAHKSGTKIESIGGNDLDDITSQQEDDDAKSRRSRTLKSNVPSEPPKLKTKTKENVMFGDLSGALTARRNADKAVELDASVYEYDSVYDSLKPKKHVTSEDVERRPKYMKGLMAAAETRKRDALIAEEKKIAREREEEGEEYAGKEKFVTQAYKKQQEENRRLEEEEKRKEEEEAKKNKGGGMSAFYRQLLNKDEERHADAMRAADEVSKKGGDASSADAEVLDEGQQEKDKVQDLKKKGANIAVNEDGEVVDKRQLLRGGLNIEKKKQQQQPADLRKTTERGRQGDGRNDNGGQMGRKQAMRERQSRMLEEQLEQSMKRAREDTDEKRLEAERSAKSQKTQGEISSAKERYLARKKAAEEEKKKSGAGPGPT